MNTFQAGNQLRILTVTNLWPVGDSFRGIFVQEQVEALRRLGLHVDVEIVAQARGKADYLLAAPRVRRRAHSGDYHLVHVHYGLTALAARLVTGVPRVLSLYGSDLNIPWQRAVTKLSWGGTAARTYPSPQFVARFRDRAGYAIPNGVDFTLFAPTDRTAARTALGIAPDESVVLFGGHPDNQIKGYDLFVDVLAEVRARGVAVRELILAEPGQPRTEVPRKFDTADVLLFTSRKGTEGSPTVVKEASVMGLPVVSVGVGDVAQTLSGVTPSAVVDYPEEANGDKARTDLVGMLADRVAEILASGQRSNGRERNGELDSMRIAARVTEVYQRVLDPAGAGQRAALGGSAQLGGAA